MNNPEPHKLIGTPNPTIRQLAEAGYSQTDVANSTGVHPDTLDHAFAELSGTPASREGISAKVVHSSGELALNAVTVQKPGNQGEENNG